MAMGTGQRLEAIAQDLFEVLTRVYLFTLRGRRRPGDLKELEYLTLSILQAHQPMIVGNIQRLLGVLPAQMSRIIRSLEARDLPLISCRINTQDKRKIDVTLTDAGEKALALHQEGRIARLTQRLQALADEDQEELVQLVQKLSALLERSSIE